MKKLIFSALLSAAAIFATPTASVTFIGAPANAPSIGHGVVSPYLISLNGIEYNALCIDFADSISLGETWNAYLSTPGGNISHTYHPSSTSQYEEEAYIYQQITKPGISAQTQIDLQEAAWDIMDPGYWGSDNTYKPDTAALIDVAAAQTNYSHVDFGKYEVVSGSTPGCDRPQEFLIDPTSPVPEPASCALFGGGLLIAAGALRAFRRKQTIA